ncbi:MAG: SHD1 domain-containing protein [Planctomycetota bacterium]|nr:SHD1 domain-containing protein [Planctomycetota bacterium]
MIARITLGLFVLSLVASARAAEPLRYKWQPDQQFVYELQITVDLPTKVETMQGTIAYQVKSVDSPLRIGYRGGLKTSSKDKPGRSSAPASPSRRPGPPHPDPFGGRMLGPGGRLAQPANQLQGLTTTTNQISLTPMGEILELQGSSQLPYLLGNLSLMVIEPLPDQDRPSWSVEGGVVIKEKGQQGGPARPFGHPLSQPTGGGKPEKTTSGSRSSSFTRESESGDNVIFKKTFRLESPGDTQSIAVEGEGRWTFNRKLGMSESLDFSQRLTVKEKNVSFAIPLTIKYHRLSEDELAKTEYNEARPVQRKGLWITYDTPLPTGLVVAANRFRQPETTYYPAEVVAILDNGLVKVKYRPGIETEDRLREDIFLAPPDVDQPRLDATQLTALQAYRDEVQRSLGSSPAEATKKERLNLAYRDGNDPLPETGAPVTNQTPLPKYLVVAAKRKNQWYQAHVSQTLPDGRIAVRFSGAEKDATVARSDLQLPPADVKQPNVPLTGASPTSSGAPATSGNAGAVFRTWTDTTGQFSIEAKFVAEDGDKVRLVNKDGKELKMPLAKLRESDRKYVESLRQPAAVNPFTPQ